MRRTLLTGAVVLLAQAGGVASAAPAADKPPLAAKVTACTTGTQPTARAATFTASMPAAKGTKRMSMRFRLLQRRGTKGPYRAVDVPEWAAVERSDPGRPGFIFTKRVANLLAPAAYKAVVRFRWYDKRGRIQREATRTTSACRQPDPRPDLRVGELTGTVRDKDSAVYEFVVRNDGRGVADAFGVELTIAGYVQTPVTLGPLAPGTRDKGRVVGPRCRPGDVVTIDVDSEGIVDEAVESDNVVDRPCPLLA
jgi:hypothetical protein